MAELFKGMKIGKAMMPMAVQACTFLPFFWSLRSMANLPVESMKHGGIFWFTDLTNPDQFYILPITTSATLGLMLWVRIFLFHMTFCKKFQFFFFFFTFS